MDLKDIFQNSVLNEIQEQNKKKSLTSQYEREVASAKKKQLAPVQEFLQMFVDSQIYVKHCDYYTSKNHEPQLFSFFLGDSSKSWSPGVSIFIEHPEIEIAIPNNKHDGQIVIFISSPLTKFKDFKTSLGIDTPKLAPVFIIFLTLPLNTNQTT